MKKRGQIWVETVIYTLIAFVMIGVTLSFAKPKIEEFQDKAIIEQSINIMNKIDSMIKEVEKRGIGNQREVELELSKGELKISGINDRIIFEMESRYQYSEPDKDYTRGNLIINTDDKGDLNEITITRDYILKYDITYEDLDNIKTISKAATPYTLLISNKGENLDGRTKINFEMT